MKIQVSWIIYDIWFGFQKQTKILHINSNFSKTEPNYYVKKIKLTFPVKPKFRGKSSVDCSIIFICNGAGVQVVARVPSAGPVPPPINVVMPT